MKTIPQISESEWEIMKILWAENPLKASDIIEKLKGVTPWQPKTVKTLLNRLIKKDALTYVKDNYTYLYYPNVSEDECVREETKSFINRVYNGSLNLLVKNFVDKEKLSREQIEELKKILEDKG